MNRFERRSCSLLLLAVQLLAICGCALTRPVPVSIEEPLSQRVSPSSSAPALEAESAAENEPVTLPAPAPATAEAPSSAPAYHHNGVPAAPPRLAQPASDPYRPVAAAEPFAEPSWDDAHAAPTPVQLAEPSYATLPPKQPLKYGDSSIFSLAISYTLGQDALLKELQSRRVSEPKSATHSPPLLGKIKGAPRGKYRYFKATIYCERLTCNGGGTNEVADSTVIEVSVDPMIWEWPLTPQSNDGGNAVIKVNVFGAHSAAGPFFSLETIPPVWVEIRLQKLSWIAEHGSKLATALASLVAVIGTVLGWLKLRKPSAKE